MVLPRVSMAAAVGLAVVSANFLFAAVGDDAVADDVHAAPCGSCGLVHVHSSLGQRRMWPAEWARYRVLCGRVGSGVAR